MLPSFWIAKMLIWCNESPPFFFWSHSFSIFQVTLLHHNFGTLQNRSKLNHSFHANSIFEMGSSSDNVHISSAIPHVPHDRRSLRTPPQRHKTPESQTGVVVLKSDSFFIILIHVSISEASCIRSELYADSCTEEWPAYPSKMRFSHPFYARFRHKKE